MNVSPEVEELVQRMMHVADYPTEDAVLVAALHALGAQRETQGQRDQGPVHRVSALGLQLQELRSQYVAGGGDLLTIEQFDAEMAQRRGTRDLGE
jgi:hypothetical protein